VKHKSKHYGHQQTAPKEFLFNGNFECLPFAHLAPTPFFAHLRDINVAAHFPYVTPLLRGACNKAFYDLRCLTHLLFLWQLSYFAYDTFDRCQAPNAAVNAAVKLRPSRSLLSPDFPFHPISHPLMVGWVQF